MSNTPTLAAIERPASGQTPYSAWMQTDTLHSLQRTVSDHPGEHAWIVHVQVSELYWMLIIKEIQSAQAFLRADDLPQAWRTLQRVVAHHAPLDAIWRSIDWMTPNDLLAILSRAVATHGKDTALQGWTYRQMVYLLGIKQAEHLQHFEPQPHRWEQLNKALAEPSLYDDVLAFLRRRGWACRPNCWRATWPRPTRPARRSKRSGARSTPTPTRTSSSSSSARPWPTSPRASATGNSAT